MNGVGNYPSDINPGDPRMPWNQPDPPGWWDEYESACYEIGVEPRELDWEDGEADAVEHLEEIRDAAIAALKYL